MSHEMYVTKCKVCGIPNLTYFRYGMKENYNKCECKQPKQNNMKIQIKEHDYFKREHLVSYNFTVRTNGYNSWKINVVIKCGNEKLDFDYLSNSLIIDSYMTMIGDEAKGLFLRKNMPIEIQMEVFSWLSDFPRYHIIETSTMEKICNERTYADAQDEQNNFSFETIIVDTWKLL